MEEIDIFKDELAKIVKDLREMEEKLKNPNIDSSALKGKYQETVKKAQEKKDDMIAYEKRARATIAQRQKNLLVEHLGDIRKAISKVSNNKKLDLVLNSSETQLGVFYAATQLDITGDVIALLNSIKETGNLYWYSGALIIHEFSLKLDSVLKELPDLEIREVLTRA